MQSDTQLQPKLAQVAAQRRIKDALPVLSGLMADPRDPVRLAAIKSYGELAEIEQLPTLLSEIQNCTQKGDIAALGKAIALVCIRANDPQACVPQLIATIKVAVPEAKPMLDKVLKRMGGAEALKK
jgi:HEAT repeat protein